MNERIEAFIDQMSRTGLPYQAGDRELTVTGSDLEYFAELIVKECAKEAFDFWCNQVDSNEESAQWHIKGHFGVE